MTVWSQSSGWTPYAVGILHRNSFRRYSCRTCVRRWSSSVSTVIDGLIRFGGRSKAPKDLEIWEEGGSPTLWCDRSLLIENDVSITSGEVGLLLGNMRRRMKIDSKYLVERGFKWKEDSSGKHKRGSQLGGQVETESSAFLAHNQPPLNPPH